MRNRIVVDTHDEPAVGTRLLGCPASSELEFDAADLLAVVGAAPSSASFEGALRAIIGGVLERYAGLPDDVFVYAKVELLRLHRVVAQRAGPLADLRS